MATAIKAKRPLPARPVGAPPPITSNCKRSPVQMTLLIAPPVASWPQLISPPSKAGPAGTEVASQPSALPMAISPLVPRSIQRESPVAGRQPIKKSNEIAADITAEQREDGERDRELQGGEVEGT